jgi:hypothetical protein
MKKTLILALLIFSITDLIAQKKYLLPSGYKIYIDFNDKPVRIDKDFDNDGIPDLAIMTEKENENGDNYLFVFLSSIFNVNDVSYYIPIQSTSAYNLEYSKQVLTIGGCFGNGRYCESYKFKYYSNLKNMRLIGYNEESFGNAIHEGSYNKSINFLTKKMEYFERKKITKTINIGIITLENFDEKIREKLNNLK